MGRDVALVIGASSGLGEQVLSMLSERGAYPVGAARRVERLQSLASTIGGESVPFDAMDESSYESFFARVEEIVSEQGAGRLLVTYTPGFHELELLSDEQLVSLSTPPDAGMARAMLGDEYHKMYALNVSAPKRIVSFLERSSVPVSFAYVSSQAAEDQWHALGNALYGPQKREMEVFLQEHSSQVSMFALRYPFFRSEMGRKVFDKLSLWDEGLRSSEWSQVSASVDEVARPTAELLFTSRSDSFVPVSDVVYSFRR